MGEAVSIQPKFNGSEDPTGHAESDQAKQTFLERVRHIQGVRGIECIGGHAVRVSVPEHVGPVADQVYELEDSVRSAFPSACLDVWVSVAP